MKSSLVSMHRIVTRTSVLLFLFFVELANSGQYHVTVNGTSSGAGTIASPWSLARGIDVDRTPHPVGGDTLWIHGGTYTTSTIWDIELSGTSNVQPVIVRNWNNEHVILVSTTSHPAAEWTVFLRGNYLWVWGLDIYASTRNAGDASNVVMGGNCSKLINNYIHDGQAVGVTSQQMQGAEVYGNVINYNGREQVADEGVGYGVYAQNVPSTPRVRKEFYDNLIYYNWGWNWQAYTESGTLDSMVFEGNVVVGSGLFWQRSYPTTRTWGPQFLIMGPTNFCRWFQMKDNHFLQDPATISTSTGGNYFGLFGSTAITDMTMTGNYMVGPRDVASFDFVGSPNTITNNVIVGPHSIPRATYPSNTFLSSWPSARADDISVRKNKYESNRGHIIVWNWDETPTVSVNPNAGATILRNGDTYVVKDALNPWGTSVASGTYNGGNITIPMTGLTAAMPVWPDTNIIPQPLHGWRKVKGDEYFQGQPPPHTAPRFATFILIGSNSSTPLPSGSFGAIPDTLPAGGGSVTLSWTSQNATSASIDQGIGTVTLSGSRTDTVGVTRTYRLTLTNSTGSQTYTAWVGVALPSGQGPQDITIQGTPVALITTPGGSGNPSIEVARDGVTPPVGSSDPLQQYDTYTNGSSRTFDWIGYTFPSAQTFSRVVFQEGMHFATGGWFTNLRVQVRNGTSWTDVPSVVSIPPYGGTNGINYETYDLAFPSVTGTGIRIAGAPGGSGYFISVGELRVLNNGTTDVGGGPYVPRDFGLDQNYPNPFNPSTRIGFKLPAASRVLLTVYNTLGQEIARLIDGPLSAGIHEVEFSAGRLSNGIYLYQLIAGDFSAVRKMILLK
ncbi:MAG TPA: T9SS type A sorting domain-containing protein [Bacteroidota bacterium]|nr:T9SS type A sorting domain-containing protein [Bacteroidota bacterium]